MTASAASFAGRPSGGPVVLVVSGLGATAVMAQGAPGALEKIYRLLEEGERAGIDATREVVLRVGDASNLDLPINGASVRRLGAAGEAVTVSITPQNVGQFLAQ